MADVLTEKQRHYNMSRIQSQKKCSKSICLVKSFDIERMMQDILVNPILFFPSTKP